MPLTTLADLLRTHRAPLKLCDIVEFTRSGRTLKGVIVQIDRGADTTWYKVRVMETPSNRGHVGDTYYFSAVRAARELTQLRAATR